MSSSKEDSRQAMEKQQSDIVCGAWVPRAGSVRDSPSALVLLGHLDCNSSRSIDVREYNFDSDTLSDTIHAIETEDGRPWQFAVHPSGDGFLCSFSNSCKFYEINPKGLWKLKASERRLPLLQGKQIQTCICFSSDGSFLATGGKDGHLRLYTWPACHLVLDERHARPIQDVDISMDSAYVASIAEDGVCRVWDITKGECIARLRREKEDEKFGYCRFSRDGTQAFLFASFTKGFKGYVGVWNMVDWSKIGAKMLADLPISCLAITRDGKSLCYGTKGGDMAVISVRKMEVTQVVTAVDCHPIWLLEFSKHGRSLLILGLAANARVSRLEMSERKDWQRYMVLVGMIALSGLLLFAFFESSLSDDFWKFPMGRVQPALPSPETTWGYPSY